MKKTAQEKILSVLEIMKEQYDLSPKGSYTVMSGGSGYSHPAGEIRIHLNELTYECDLSYAEIEKIFGKLKEDGLIKRFEVLGDYM